MIWHNITAVNIFQTGSWSLYSMMLILSIMVQFILFRVCFRVWLHCDWQVPTTATCLSLSQIHLSLRCTLSFKYGHICVGAKQNKNKPQNKRLQQCYSQRLITRFHKPLSDVPLATYILLHSLLIYGISNLLWSNYTFLRDW